MTTEKSSQPGGHLPAGDSLRSFWDWTGVLIPPFFEAPSTRYYLECEKILFETFLPGLKGKRVFKTDLWDEAKNTRILNWVAGSGAQAFGLDISEPVVREARSSFGRDRLELTCLVSDLRAAGLKDASFDCIYSMGTVEHFPEYQQALRECFRLLKKGGRAVIGVPNKLDPFLRPLLVSFLQALGLYAFGEERSFTMKALVRALQGAGFRVTGCSGILFLPGWLRMIDLFWHTRWPRSNFLLAPLFVPFSLLYKRFPALRRWGYLIACAVEKP
jgi:SAM-dependent methyltransferase